VPFLERPLRGGLSFRSSGLLKHADGVKPFTQHCALLSRDISNWSRAESIEGYVVLQGEAG